MSLIRAFRNPSADFSMFTETTAYQRQLLMDWNELPRHVLTSILQFCSHSDLWHARLVCWSWYLAVYDRQLWKLTSLQLTTGDGYYHSSRLLRRIANFIQGVSIGTERGQRENFQKVLGLLPWSVLQTLSLNKCSYAVFTGTTLRILKHHISEAKQLRLVNLGGLPVDDDVIGVLGQVGMASLEELDLTHCFSVTSTGLLHLVAVCQRLRVLKISYCHLSDDLFHVLSSKKLKALDRLDVVATFRENNRQLSTRSWQCLMKQYPRVKVNVVLNNLEEDSVATACQNLFPPSSPAAAVHFKGRVNKLCIQLVAQNCPNLRSFIVHANPKAMGSTDVGPELVKLLSSHRRSLIHLECTGVSVSYNSLVELSQVGKDSVVKCLLIGTHQLLIPIVGYNSKVSAEARKIVNRHQSLGNALYVYHTQE